MSCKSPLYILTLAYNNKNITLNLGGNKLTGTVTNKANLTILNGTIQCIDSSTNGTNPTPLLNNGTVTLGIKGQEKSGVSLEGVDKSYWAWCVRKTGSDPTTVVFNAGTIDDKCIRGIDATNITITENNNQLDVSITLDNQDVLREVKIPKGISAEYIPEVSAVLKPLPF